MRKLHVLKCNFTCFLLRFKPLTFRCVVKNERTSEALDPTLLAEKEKLAFFLLQENCSDKLIGYSFRNLLKILFKRENICKPIENIDKPIKRVIYCVNKV